MKHFNEILMKVIFFIAACTSVLAVALICIFLFANGVPAMGKIGLGEFLTGTMWKPSNDIFGIFPMILGSIYVTAGAIIIGVPIGLCTAVFMAHYCPKNIYGICKASVNLMAGVPSVVYGFFGLVLTASILLGIMILPTIVSVCEAAIRSVPTPYYEGALALGATKERSIFLTVIPAAKSGIVAGIVLGIGRAIGETMAVVMVAGNQARMPKGITRGVRTLTSNIVLEMGYAADLHREALIATGVVLFVFILLINLFVAALKRQDTK